MIFGLFILGLVLSISIGVIVNWRLSSKEYHRVQDLIQSTNPIEKTDIIESSASKTTKIEGFRTRMKQFKNTLVGVGNPGNR